MEDKWPAPARVSIPCGIPGCRQPAAAVEVIPNGGAYADGQKDILHVLKLRGTLRVSDFLLYANYSTPVGDYGDIVDAVLSASEDAAAGLFRLDKEYAPFFCATCGCSYCATHWKLVPTFDQGFDYYSGTCPVQHFKVIDH